MDLSVSAVPAGSVDSVWGQIEPLVARALKHGEGDSTTSWHIGQAIRHGLMFLWVVHDGSEIIAIVVLEVVKYPAKQTLRVVLIGGRSFHDWAPKVQTLIRDYKALIGADTIEVSARDGMVKWLTKMGWRRKATIMELKDE